MNLIGTVTKMPFMIREIFISEWTLSLRAPLLHLQTDQEMVSKMTSKRLMKDFKCLPPLAWYIAKPNIANGIDEGLLCGCMTFQWEIHD